MATPLEKVSSELSVDINILAGEIHALAEVVLVVLERIVGADPEQLAALLRDVHPGDAPSENPVDSERSRLNRLNWAGRLLLVDHLSSKVADLKEGMPSNPD